MGVNFHLGSGKGVNTSFPLTSQMSIFWLDNISFPYVRRSRPGCVFRRELTQRADVFLRNKIRYKITKQSYYKLIIFSCFARLLAIVRHIWLDFNEKFPQLHLGRQTKLFVTARPTIQSELEEMGIMFSQAALQHEAATKICLS